MILKPGGKSVEEESLSDVDSNRLCLTEPSMLQLGFIAIKVENELGQLKPVDIEWAITGVTFSSLGHSNSSLQFTQLRVK